MMSRISPSNLSWERRHACAPRSSLLSRTPTVPLHMAYFFVLDYDAMKRLNLNPYSAMLVLVLLLAGCSGHDENSGSSNTNATQQANSNSSPQPQIAQSNAPAVAPGTVPPAVQVIPPAPSPDEKSAAAGDPNAATSASVADNARAPKLVVSGKKLDYGKQPQGKTLVRAIVVKNGGRTDLKIDSVAPS
jgi:hypothetical protein